VLKKIDVKRFGKVAVLYGGTSAEREVSLMSGRCVYDALIRKGVDAHLLDVRNNFVNEFQEKHFDRAFIILHGRGGEDGAIQAQLEELHVPYTGSNVESSRLAMDKIKTKQIWLKHQLPTLPFVLLTRQSKVNSHKLIKEMGLPLCVKPVHEGSSYGVTHVKTIEEFDLACEHAYEYDTEIMVEPWIYGREFTVPVVQDIVAPVIEICSASDYYDYKAKYFSDKTKFYCPCDLPIDIQEKLQTLAKRGSSLLGCSGWSRIDFLSNGQGDFWLAEANTVPGMTTHSLVPMGMKVLGVDYDNLVLMILETSEDKK